MAAETKKSAAALPIKLKTNIAAAVQAEDESAKLFVDSNDVIRLMLQYCHENNLKKSFAALQVHKF